MTKYTEDSLIEKPAIALFADLGWVTTNCYEETFGLQGSLGRETPNEVLLLSRLAPALERLNPALPPEAYQLAIEELSRDRSLMSPAHANREVYQLLKDGVKVAFRNEDGVDYEAKHKIYQSKGKLGVFWHTQCSSKSYSMVFFAIKVLSNLPAGKW